MQKLNLLLIGNNQLKNYFSKNFNIYTFQINDNFSISSICKDLNIDVILQVENLGKREIIHDLNEQKCLKIFWAIDIHLNFYWQKYYFKNFDIILSSQKNFVKLYKERKVYWLPWGIPDESINKEFIPFEKRKYTISFVGLIDENRIKRKYIIELLKKNFDLNIFGDKLSNRLDFNNMLEIYKNSWIVVNESINNDVNFRYFEATSQGALLYTEKINNGEDILFIDKKEILFFSQLNLINRLKYFLKNPDKLEKIAFNGWSKCLKFHKLSDRVKIIEKIIFENLKFSKKREKSIHFPVLFTYLRAIGYPSYKLILTHVNRFFDKRLNELNDFFLKIEHLDFLEAKKKILKFISQNYNSLPLYHVGYINMFPEKKIILSLYELIVYVFKKFKESSKKDKDLNYVGGKILFESGNFQGAASHFINLVRDYPDKILFRKYLAICYFKIFQLDLFHREVLKILILEKKFSDFKKYNIDNKVKEEIIYELSSRINDKKFLRDIIFNLL